MLKFVKFNDYEFRFRYKDYMTLFKRYFVYNFAFSPSSQLKYDEMFGKSKKITSPDTVDEDERPRSGFFSKSKEAVKKGWSKLKEDKNNLFKRSKNKNTQNEPVVDLSETEESPPPSNLPMPSIPPPPPPPPPPVPPVPRDDAPSVAVTSPKKKITSLSDFKPSDFSSVKLRPVDRSKKSEISERPVDPKRKITSLSEIKQSDIASVKLKRINRPKTPELSKKKKYKSPLEEAFSKKLDEIRDRRLISSSEASNEDSNNDPDAFALSPEERYESPRKSPVPPIPPRFKPEIPPRLLSRSRSISPSIPPRSKPEIPPRPKSTPPQIPPRPRSKSLEPSPINSSGKKKLNYDEYVKTYRDGVVAGDTAFSTDEEEKQERDRVRSEYYSLSPEQRRKALLIRGMNEYVSDEDIFNPTSGSDYIETEFEDLSTEPKTEQELREILEAKQRRRDRYYSMKNARKKNNRWKESYI